MWAPLEALEPAWLREWRWRRRSRRRRAEALAVQQEYRRIRRERGVISTRTALEGGAGLTGMVLGALCWPTWWPQWSAWAFLAAGTLLGVCSVKLYWVRWG